MFSRPRSLFAAGLTAAALVAAPVAFSHLDQDEPMQSYRQSYFTLLAMNFSPIADMVKGDRPWDDDMIEAFAHDFAAVASANVARAFPPGSDKGKTRAKPEIWENMDDFGAKFADLQEAAAALKLAVDSGDKSAIGMAVKNTGGACKACHDEYKSKDYLY
jgi:cytochrome c556